MKLLSVLVGSVILLAVVLSDGVADALIAIAAVTQQFQHRWVTRHRR
jgi:hypothetical protein